MSRLEFRTHLDLKKYLGEATGIEPSDKMAEELFMRLYHTTTPEQMKSIYSIAIQSSRNYKRPFDDCFIYIKQADIGRASWDDMEGIFEAAESQGLDVMYGFIADDKFFIKIKGDFQKEKLDSIFTIAGYRPNNKH